MDGCETMEVWLSLRLDGMLEPEEERELEAHLAVCPRCRALARELETIHAALPQLEDCPAPEGFARGVMERIGALEEKPKVVPLFRRPQVRALMGLAACAVLCIGLYRGGVLDRGVSQMDAVAAGSGLDTALYQGAEDRSAGGESAGKEQNEPVMPQDLSPERSGGETRETNEANQGEGASVPDGSSVPQAQDSLSESQPKDSLDGSGSPDSVQPSQFQITAQASEPYTVAGQSVFAVLTLDRLPQGWEDVLGGSPQWLVDEAGRTCCIITWTQLEQMQALAEQEETITAGLAGAAEGEQACALVLLEAP